jgi:hypothetical protein
MSNMVNQRKSPTFAGPHAQGWDEKYFLSSPFKESPE